MGAIDNTRLENDMIDHMWSFLQMGGLKSNYPALKSACMELRQMMMANSMFLEAASKIGICRRQKQNRRSQSEKISYICDSITAG